jgi:GNAT superfamily N-acetyltransferase
VDREEERMADTPGEKLRDLEVRVTTRDDLPALVAVRNTPGLFREYLDEAANGGIPFFVVTQRGKVLGFARLKLPRESDKPNAKRPLISDVCVAAEHRWRGVGSAFIARLESIVHKLGHERLYIGVDPVASPRVFALYKRLGYVPVQDEPFEAEMLFHDAQGGPAVKKKYWRIELVKNLAKG